MHVGCLGQLRREGGHLLTGRRGLSPRRAASGSDSDSDSDSAAMAAGGASARSVANSPVAASLAACQMAWTAPAAMPFNAAGKAEWSMVTRVRPEFLQERLQHIGGHAPMLPLPTRPRGPL